MKHRYRSRILWWTIRSTEYYPIGLREKKEQVLHLVGRWDHLFRMLSDDLQVAERNGLTAEQARCLYLMGVVQGQRGQPDEAIPKLIAAEERYGILNDGEGLYQCQLGLVQAYFQLGSYQSAEDLAEELLSRYDCEEKRCEVQNILGVIYRYTGRPRLSMKNYEKSLAYYRQHGQITNLIKTLIQIGNIHSDEHQFREALDYYGQAEPLVAKIGSAYLRYHLSYNLAIAYAGLGDIQGARTLCLEALCWAEKLGDRIGQQEIKMSLNKIDEEQKRRNDINMEGGPGL